MNDTATINYLTQREIDKSKWDERIRQSQNGRIYAYSFYLDAMAENWDALVLGDYDLVMPLPWKKKFGFSYIYQPFVTAQLGLFGNNITQQGVEKFIKSVPAKFRLIEFSLNSGNYFTGQHKPFTPRVNYELLLDPSYDQLSNAYRENHKRNIKKTWQMGCTLKKDIDVAEVMNLAVEHAGTHHAIQEIDRHRFLALHRLLREKNMATTYGIYSNRDELLASCVFFFSHFRAYYILVGNHPNGKTLGASHALIDAFIKDNAGKDIILDFEGSDIRNLAFFYSGFGAKEVLYPAVRWNRLPIYLKWLKN